MIEQLPSAKEIRDLFADLLGRDVTVSVGDRHAATAWAVVAVFTHDDLAVSGVIAFDLPLAAAVGAAVGLVPPGGAQACVEDGELSPMIADNLAEVCNVLTGLFNRAGGRHVRLHALHTRAADVPADVRGRLAGLGHRFDLRVVVSGYPAGALGFLLPA